MMNEISLHSFQRNDAIIPELNILLTIKSFDVDAIRRRYLKSKKNKSGKAGSVERRGPSIGGVASLQVLPDGLVKHSILSEMKEPRGIDIAGDRLAISAEDRVYIHGTDSNHYTLTDPWFSYIHTVKFSPFDPRHILIASSGLDTVMEYDYTSNSKTYEWNGWENGWNTGYDPKTSKAIILTRDPKVAIEHTRKGLHSLLISDPKEQTLPTSMRAAFINSVEYDPDDPSRFIATFFHEGAVFAISRETGQSKCLIAELSHPHGGKVSDLGVFVTSTADGSVILKRGDDRTRYSFRELPGKGEIMGEKEWIQNSVLLDEDRFISIDSNRSLLFFVDIPKKEYATIKHPVNWAIQDMVICADHFDQHTQWLRSL